MRILALTGAFIAFAAASTLVSHASTAVSAWFEGPNFKVRLISGGEPADDGLAIYAAVEIDLAENWKTYWRHPGNAGGIPPSFDWSGSENLKSATVLYPVPKRLDEEVGTSLVYKNTAVIPVRMLPADPAQPVTLSLKMFFGVCEEICIPADADLTLSIDPAEIKQMPPAIARALGAVPVTVSFDKAKSGANGLRLVSVDPSLGGKEPHLLVTVASEAGLEPDVLAYSTGDWILGVPERVSSQSDTGYSRFRVPIEFSKPGALSGEDLWLVVRGGNRAIETNVRLP